MSGSSLVMFGYLVSMLALIIVAIIVLRRHHGTDHNNIEQTHGRGHSTANKRQAGQEHTPHPTAVEIAHSLEARSATRKKRTDFDFLPPEYKHALRARARRKSSNG